MAANCGPGFVPGWVPNWIFCPQDKILNVVYSALVDGFDIVLTAVLGAILAAFGSIQTALTAAGGAIGLAGGRASSALIGVMDTLGDAIVSASASSGIGGPLLAAILFAVGVILVLFGVRFGTNLLKWVT